MSPNDDKNGTNTLHIQTPRDLGVVIRAKRRQLGLSQTDLAQKAGVGRQWLVAIERGKSTAEIGLVLRTLAGLGLSLTVADSPAGRTGRGATDIDVIVKAARESGN
jgi:HTH-type transcriptional regulator/antitoxin HipB